MPPECLREGRQKETAEMSLVIFERHRPEMHSEMLAPNLFVTVECRSTEIFLSEGEICLLPEADNGLVVDGCGLRIHRLHVFSGFLLHGLAGPTVIFVVLRAQTIRTLHPSRLTVYNLGDVVPDEEDV